MSTPKKKKIDLGVTEHSLFGTPIHRVPVVAKGTGSRDIEFPDDEALVKETLKKAKGKRGKIKVTKEAAEPASGKDGLLFRRGVGSLGSLWDIIRPVPVVPKMRDADYDALLSGADAIQRRMVARQYDDLMEQIFGELVDTATWGVNNMPADLRPPLEDHLRQVLKLRAQVEKALPMIVAELAKRNPGVPASAILKHAIEMLAEQLSPIVSILRVYSAALGQYRSGRYARQLRCINTYMESCYRLWTNGDVDGTHPDAPPQIPLSSLTVGMRLMSMIGGPGLGTIPGANGPVGLSLLMYPLDMLDWISMSLTLNSHESGHQIFADIKGFEPEMQRVVQKAVVSAVRSSTLQFQTPTSMVVGNRVPTHELVVKMITDCIGEIEADVAAVLVNGPAYLYGMLLSFPAMLVREGRVKDAKQLLRTSSVYMLEPQDDGTAKLEFEPHPPDYIRAYLVAAMVEEMGYKADADLLRKLADQMVGKTPSVLTWEDASGESKDVITIKVADIKVVAPVVAKALMRTKLPQLGDKSLSDLVMFGPKQHVKAVALKNNLLAGKSDIPFEMGSMYPTLVGSGVAMAFWEALHGKDGNVVLTELEENTLKMLEKLASR